MTAGGHPTDMNNRKPKVRIMSPIRSGFSIPAVVIFMAWAFAAAPASGAVDIPDAAVADAVVDALTADFAVSAANIDVETQRGVVYLNGRVRDLRAKNRAGRLAETVKGVVAVANHLTVSPARMRSDAAIRRDVERALFVDPVTESADISVAVEDGVVCLVGDVDSREEKRLAGKLVRGVEGVYAVENDIAVESDEKRPDWDIRSDVESRLRWSSRVDDALISVQVNNGNVRLSGTVGSAAEKNLAVANAWVKGARSVDAGGLKVDPSIEKKALQGEK